MNNWQSFSDGEKLFHVYQDYQTKVGLRKRLCLFFGRAAILPKEQYPFLLFYIADHKNFISVHLGLKFHRKKLTK
jgi:hypothetical protein